MRINKEDMLFQICELISKRSQCKRAKVGAIIVKDGRVISTGYNGPAYGITCTSCRLGCDISIHAEINAITFAAKEGINVNGSTLYCNYSPCIRCANAIIMAGIKKVNYKHEYRRTEGIALLAFNEVEIKQYEVK